MLRSEQHRNNLAGLHRRQDEEQGLGPVCIGDLKTWLPGLAPTYKEVGGDRLALDFTREVISGPLAAWSKQSQAPIRLPFGSAPASDTNSERLTCRHLVAVQGEADGLTRSGQV